MRVLKTVVLLILFGSGLYAQPALRFPAAALTSQAMELIGDSLAWPVLMSFADYQAATNSFTIAPTASPAIRKFRSTHQEVLVATRKQPSQVKSGARVFGAEELKKLEKALVSYNRLMASGSVDSCMILSPVISGLSISLDKAIEKNRLSRVEARLDEKSGVVGKRKGLLGTWNSVEAGMLYEENDGVRTYAESRANLSFRDGTQIIMEELSMATITQSRLDNLTQGVKTEVSLVNGSLLAKISERSKQRGDFRLQIGTTRSELQTNRFWANREEEKRVQLSNYDGEANLTSGGVTITLRKNQGTVVVEGKAPQLPVDLLPSPRLNWPRQDSVIYSNEFVFQWSPVRDATRYLLELATDQDFTKIVDKRYVTATRLSDSFNLEEPVYIRLQAFDKQGLRGTDSPLYRLVRNTDEIPPAVFLFGINGSVFYSATDTLTIRGQTEPFCRLLIDNNPVAVDLSGQFMYPEELKTGSRSLIIQATDRAGNSRETMLRVVRMEPSVLSKIKWNVPVADGSVHAGSGILSASGKAYPGLDVKWESESGSGTVRTGPDGQWAITTGESKPGKIWIRFFQSGSGLLIYEYSIEVR